MRNPLQRILIGAGAIAVVLVAWFAFQVVAIGGPGRTVFVTVNSGDSVSSLAGELQSKGVIHSSLAFRLDMLLGAPVLHPGTYAIAQNSSFAEVKRVFGGTSNVVSVTPGMTIYQVATRYFSANFASSLLAAARTSAEQSSFHPNLAPPSIAKTPPYVNPFEGLIGVGNYVLAPGESAQTLLAQMSARFLAQAQAVGLTSSTSLNGLSAYQLLIAASIVEREGYIAKNMPQVARVIFNRLARGGSLQMDSTIEYPLGMDGGTITSALLKTVTPYNTYLTAGLTPTPICAVSTTAISAVLHAPPGDWLFFTLVKKDGTMAFAKTFAEQLANERLAQRNGIG
jgi:UPF0755 protein